MYNIFSAGWDLAKPYVAPAAVWAIGYRQDLQARILKNQADLLSLYPTTYRAEACHVIAEYAKGFFLDLADQDSRVPPNESIFGAWGRTIQNESDLIRSAVEATLLKGFRNLSLRINALEHDKEGRLELGESLLEVTLRFFTKITQITKNGKKHLTDNSIRAHFAQDETLNLTARLGLHPSNSPKGKAERLEGFYKELGELLLNIFCPNGKNDLETPDYEWIRDKAWDALKAKIPNMLFAMARNILERNTRNQMLLSSLEALFPTSEEAPDPDFTPPALPAAVVAQPEPPLLTKDKERAKTNNERAGNLAKELIHLFPQSFLRMFYFLPPFKGVTGAILGPILQKEFETRNYDMLIDKGIKKGLPEWHPGDWVGDYPKRTFRPKEVDEQGNPVFKFKYTDPTPAEVAEKKNNEKIVEDRLRGRIKDLLASNASVISQLENLGSRISWRIPKYSLGVCFYLFVYAPWKILWYSVLTPFRWWWSRHLDNQTERVMQILHMDINEHLFCSLTKVMFERLNNIRV